MIENCMCLLTELMNYILERKIEKRKFATEKEVLSSQCNHKYGKTPVNHITPKQAIKNKIKFLSLDEQLNKCFLV